MTSHLLPNQIDNMPSLCVSDMQDFSQLSSKMVTEVLMLEIKMAPAAKAYLISGFPRSMRDVVEYSDKVKTNLNPTQHVNADFSFASRFHINYARFISFIDTSR